MKRKVLFSFLIGFVLLLCGCGPSKSFNLVETEVTLYIGDTKEIEVELVKTDASALSYYIQEGGSVVVLNDNVVTANKVGIAIVGVNCSGLGTKEYTVHVIERPAIELEKEQVEIEANGTFQLVWSVIPASSPQNVTFEVEDSTVASITDAGLISGLKAGNTTLKLKSNDGNNLERTVQICVVEAKAPEFKFDGGEMEENCVLCWGDEFDKMAGITAEDNVDGDVTEFITCEGEVDNKTYGDYELVYKVSDAAGNEATFTRTVTVKWLYNVQFIGHAGSYYGVSNTEEAFVYAASVLKYQALECDLKVTYDGVFVTNHDDNIVYYTEDGKRHSVIIGNTTYEDLLKIEYSATRNSQFPATYGLIPGDGVYKAHICTLERYLEICKQYGCKAVIELKGCDGISNSTQAKMPTLMKLIEKCGMLNDTIFLGSAYNCLIWVKQHGYEYIPCQYLVNSIENQDYLDRCNKYGLDISCNVTGSYSNSDKWLKKYKQAGHKISVWTFSQYNDYDDVQKWIDKGVDFVTCDWHPMDQLDLHKRRITEDAE